MRIAVSKSFKMDCAHSLEGFVEPGHKCANMHGHTYGITIVCEGEMIIPWLVDYAEIAAAWQPIHNKLDHQNLNKVLAPMITTAENLAIWIAEQLEPALPMLSEIHVQDSTTTNVIFKVKGWRLGQA